MPVKTAPFRSSLWAWAVLAVVLAAVVFIRLRLLPVPLERDEGEFAYFGQLLLQGVPPFANAYSMKLPGIYAAYALIMAVFGQTSSGIHLGLLCVNLGTAALLFLLAKRLFSVAGGAVAASSYLVLSLSEAVLGLFAHATQFVVLFALGGCLLLLKAVQGGRMRTYFFSGLLLGLAFTMKQHAVFFCLFGFLYLAIRGILVRVPAKDLAVRALVFICGAALPLAVIMGWLLLAGVFEKFWFWTFSYAGEYASEKSFLDGLGQFLVQIYSMFLTAPFLWLSAGLGLLAVFWSRELRPHSLFVAGLLVSSLFAVSPGYYFRQHYFVLLLPAIALCCGAAASWVEKKYSSGGAALAARMGLLLVFSFSALYPLYNEKALFLDANPVEASRLVYGGNPFPESVKVADYIREHTAAQDRILVFGSEPQIYFYSGRRSATGHIYMYGLMEPQKYAGMMQEEMIREVEAGNPRYVVMVNVPTSWLVRPDSERRLFQWVEPYLARHYERVGVADILYIDKTLYLWDDRAIGYTPAANSYLLVYKRRGV